MGKLRSRSMGRSRGLVLTDAVVLLVVLVFLVSLLMPVMAGVRVVSARESCARNLSVLGKTMLIYTNDYDDDLPRAAGRNSIWAPVSWTAPARRLAYRITAADGSGGNCTISSCFYLLVKYAEVDPNRFVCPQDPNMSTFTLAGETDKGIITELAQAWDFGSQPQTHCSYTYHSPWGDYAAKTSLQPGFAVAADRNPYIASPGMSTPKTFVDPNNPAIVFNGKDGKAACEMSGNSSVHKGDGQNVLFLDTHISFVSSPCCGLENDNIYTPSRYADKVDPLGVLIPNPPTLDRVTPKTRHDSVLVHDPLTWPTVGR